MPHSQFRTYAFFGDVPVGLFLEREVALKLRGFFFFFFFIGLALGLRGCGSTVELAAGATLVSIWSIIALTVVVLSWEMTTTTTTIF